MLGLGSVSFVMPWALAALAALPALWWLLRAIPPAARRQAFPALRLLAGLVTPERSAARTPFWLLLLRMLLAVVAIFAAAHPMLGTAPVRGAGALVLAVDNGWAAAKLWPQRRAAMDNLIAQAGRDGRPVIVLATARPADGTPVQASHLMTASEARGLVRALSPLPWPVDREAAVRALADVPRDGSMRVVWLADGLADRHSAAFGAQLRRLGPLEMIAAPPAGTAVLLVPPRADARDLAPHLRRVPSASAATFGLRAVDDAGRTLLIQPVTFGSGEGEKQAVLAMPAELRNRTARIEVEGEATAGAVALLDERWRRRPVGLVDDRGGQSTSPLLDDLFYADRALSAIAEVRRGKVAELLGRSLSLAVMPDTGTLGEEDARTLRAWVEGGGVLLRLAGPNLARNPDDLLPVRLRGGGRMLGGAMSWTRPMALAPMPERGPFNGLEVPEDVRIGTQLLAEPSPDLNDKTWARLEDGTPLVTGARLGKGWLVLFHTTIGPAWGDLGMSGLFPRMLQRLLDLAQGFEGAGADRPLAPSEVLDGFGQLGPPGGTVEAFPAHAPPPPVGPQHPPGYYGDESGRRALNLASDVGPLSALGVPAGTRVSALGAPSQVRDLQPSLIQAALVLLLADLVAVLVLRGRFRWRRATTSAFALCLCGVAACGPGTARAAPARGLDIDPQAALQTRLAYVITGDAQVDETSRAGLAALSQVIERRTTASLGEPVGVDVDRDVLMVFPLLYWPVTGGRGPLAPPARDKVNDFMRNGGLILFDTQDGGDNGPDRLRALTTGLDIPALTAVTEDHVLTRSFYLLRELPGRTEGAPVFVEDGGDPANDNVSPVIIGSNDWAGAWALDRRGAPLHAVVPGGEQQREMAYRFGVNLVMYALTGSYKADQVHLPAILERLKR